MNLRAQVEHLRRLCTRACRPGRLRAIVAAACGAGLLFNLSLPAVAAAASTPTAGSALGNVGTLGSEENALSQTVTLQLSQMHTELAALQSVSQSVYGSTYGTGTTPTGSTSNSFGSTPPPLPDLPTAPASFLPYMQSLISGLNASAAQLPLPNEAAYAAADNNIETAISNLTPSEVNLMYWAISQVPNWQTLPGLLAGAAGQLAKTPVQAADQAALAGSGASSGGSTGPATSSPPSGQPSTSSPSSQQTVVVTQTSSFNPAQAPSPSSDGIPCQYLAIPFPGMPILINALNLVKLAFLLAKELTPHEITFGAVVLGEGVIGTIPDPAYDIFAGLQDGASLLLIAANLSNGLSTSCGRNAHQALLQTLYNNLANTQTTVILLTTVLVQEVGALTQIVKSRTTVIITDIGNLGKNVTQDVTTILNGQAALTQVMNVQEIQNLKNQQAAQQARALQLTLAIEHDLAAPLGDNTGTFELPSSAGGYLDSAPVGVQSVVTHLATTLGVTGATMGPDVPRLLSLADAAVVAGRYKDAYALFKITYHQLTDFGPLNPSTFAEGAPGQLQP